MIVLKQFSFFSIYGAISLVLSFLFYSLLLKKFNNFHYPFFISALTFILINFLVYLKIFRTIYSYSTIKKYFLTQIILFFSHFLLISIFVIYFNLGEIISHILGNLILSVLVFLIYKLYVFTNLKN